MAEAIKVLGQSSPAATTLTPLYTAPAPGSAVASTLSVCNMTASPTTYRASVAVSGAADAPEQYIAYDSPLAANESLFLTIGLTLGAGDVVRVYAGATDVAFGLFGAETTP